MRRKGKIVMLEAANASIIKQTSHVSLTFNFLSLNTTCLKTTCVRTKDKKNQTEQKSYWLGKGRGRGKGRAFETCLECLLKCPTAVDG